ncbi:unnamed protein product [Fraxinus pennsylvanica]|uniref:Uncharacterized protein n=1 Tax=Fraxinus pennsylvanica TaxID=56036 RepID=A0AAD1ZQB9_9LAMI|nr:unnamed protein product [Fraxinus pennsylvanica]
MLINKDLGMYDEMTGKTVKARTSKLNEELGQVEMILSDKIGTLTCNQMEFRKCSIEGISYGGEVNEGDLAASQRMNIDVERYRFSLDGSDSTGRSIEMFDLSTADASIEKEILHCTQGSDDPNAQNSRISVTGRESIIKGFNWYENFQQIPQRLCGESSTNRTNRLFSQTVDNVIRPKRNHATPMDPRLSSAKATISSEREELLENAPEMIEKDLLLLGAVAVEDKLQKGVPQCIDKFVQAGLKIWLLTGDKKETAINIGYACSLLRQDMKQLHLKLSTKLESKHQVKDVKEEILLQVESYNQMIIQEDRKDAPFALVVDGQALEISLSRNLKHQFFSLAMNCDVVICCRVSPKQKALGRIESSGFIGVVDFSYKKPLINLFCSLKNVEITRLAKRHSGKTILATGDGANDVGMIQEADIGIGISGMEGMQNKKTSPSSLRTITDILFLELLNSNRFKSLYSLNMILMCWIKLLKKHSRLMCCNQEGNFLRRLCLIHHSIAVVVFNRNARVAKSHDSEERDHITRLAKQHSGKTILATGDGANDVGMIQEADIGIGISGMEGMQLRFIAENHPRKSRLSKKTLNRCRISSARPQACKSTQFAPYHFLLPSP